MKIVFLSYLHGFGGAERQNIMLANAMVERKHKVTFISICSDNLCYELSNAIEYIFLPDKSNGIRRIFDRYVAIKEILEKLRPDIIVNFWFQPAYLTALMSKSITGKIVYSERGDPSDEEYKGILGLIRKIVFNKIDGFVFQSKGAQLYFNEKIRKRSIIIVNPVFIKRSNYPSVKERRKVIVTVGRLHPQKNQKLLIKAFFEITKKFPEYILEIYGNGELKMELEKIIQELDLDGKVRLMGTTYDIHQKIYDASLFVLSSDYEGLPNALIEAMVLGMPCISTDCRPGGAREIINHGENGIIVPVNNSDLLADAMKRMLDNPSFSEKLGLEASKTYVNYMPETVYEDWEKFLIRTIEGKKSK